MSYELSIYAGRSHDFAVSITDVDDRYGQVRGTDGSGPHEGGRVEVVTPVVPFELSVDAAGFEIATLGPFDPDFMKESVEAAVSYVRSQAEKLGIEKDLFDHTDIHVKKCLDKDINDWFPAYEKFIRHPVGGAHAAPQLGGAGRPDAPAGPGSAAASPHRDGPLPQHDPVGAAGDGQDHPRPPAGRPAWSCVRGALGR